MALAQRAALRALLAGGVLSQFEGYEHLEELDWDAYSARYGDIQRMDRILRSEGDDPSTTRWPSRPTPSCWPTSCAGIPRPRGSASGPRWSPTWATCMGGTTKEGVHLGVMGGTLDLLERGYLGREVRDGVLRFAPVAPAALDGLSHPMCFEGTALRVTLRDGAITVAAGREGAGHAVRVGVGAEVATIAPGEEHTFAAP